MKILFSQPSYSLSSKPSGNSPQLKPKNLENDSFCKSSTPQKQQSSLFLAFKGKLDDMTLKVGKGLFTRANNYFTKGKGLLIEGSKKQNSSIVNEAYDLLYKSLDHFENALPKLKSVLKEPEYAEKLNLVGTKYTELGNLTQDKSLFSRAFELFDEASFIAEKNLINEQQSYSMFYKNRETLYNALNPPKKANPIGFMTNTETGTETKVAKKIKMGFAPPETK